MTQVQGVGEKLPLQSKKFVAFILAELLWKVVLSGVLFLGIKEGAIDIYIGVIALAIVITVGGIEALYIGGQAALDKYTRLAEIATRSGQSFKTKDMQTEARPRPPAAKVYYTQPAVEKPVTVPKTILDTQEIPIIVIPPDEDDG